MKENKDEQIKRLLEIIDEQEGEIGRLHDKITNGLVHETPLSFILKLSIIILLIWFSILLIKTDESNWEVKKSLDQINYENNKCIYLALTEDDDLWVVDNCFNNFCKVDNKIIKVKEYEHLCEMQFGE